MRKLISKILITLLIVTSIFPYSYADEITQSTQDIISQGISKQEQKDVSSASQNTNNNKDKSDSKDITTVDKQNTDSNTDVDNAQNINNTDNQNTNITQNPKNNIINNNQNNQNNQNNDNPNEMTYEGTGFKVIFTLTGQWSGGHNTNIKIINTGDKAIENWHIKFTTDDKITRFWNAKI